MKIFEDVSVSNSYIAVLNNGITKLVKSDTTWDIKITVHKRFKRQDYQKFFYKRIYIEKGGSIAHAIITFMDFVYSETYDVKQIDFSDWEKIKKQEKKVEKKLPNEIVEKFLPEWRKF